MKTGKRSHFRSGSRETSGHKSLSCFSSIRTVMFQRFRVRMCSAHVGRLSVNSYGIRTCTTKMKHCFENCCNSHAGLLMTSHVCALIEIYTCKDMTFLLSSLTHHLTLPLLSSPDTPVGRSLPPLQLQP